MKPDSFIKQDNNSVITRLKVMAASILPPGSEMLLYGSRARGDNKEDSDWDIIIILNKQKAVHEDYDRYAFPFYMLGAELGEIFTPIVYGKGQWQEMSLTPFYQNVQTDKLILHDTRS